MLVFCSTECGQPSREKRQLSRRIQDTKTDSTQPAKSVSLNDAETAFVPPFMSVGRKIEEVHDELLNLLLNEDIASEVILDLLRLTGKFGQIRIIKDVFKISYLSSSFCKIFNIVRLCNTSQSVSTCFTLGKIIHSG